MILYEVVHWEDRNPREIEPSGTGFSTVEEAARNVGLADYVMAVENGSPRALNANEEMGFWREWFRRHRRRAS
jgi:hypothetical protein